MTMIFYNSAGGVLIIRERKACKNDVAFSQRAAEYGGSGFSAVGFQSGR